MLGAYTIKITGIVQGVGFRPFIYNLATGFNLKGNVYNTTEGVIINVEGNKKAIENFIESIKKNQPPLAIIHKIEIYNAKKQNFTDFKILKSNITSKKEAFIPPDSALCDKCLQEFFDKDNIRYHYPFITCTHCGPRFSIIQDIPYDRYNTSMN